MGGKRCDNPYCGGWTTSQEPKTRAASCNKASKSSAIPPRPASHHMCYPQSNHMGSSHLIRRQMGRNYNPHVHMMWSVNSFRSLKTWSWGFNHDQVRSLEAPSARIIQFHFKKWAPQIPVGGFIGSCRNLSASPKRTMTSSMFSKLHWMNSVFVCVAHNVVFACHT